MTARPFTALAIPADEARPVRMVQVEPTLEGLREHVGRPGHAPYVEAIALDVADTYVYVDEDGRLDALPHNARASRLVGSRVNGGDDIRGDALVVGSDDEGAEASLTVAALAALTRTLGLPAGSLGAPTPLRTTERGTT